MHMCTLVDELFPKGPIGAIRPISPIPPSNMSKIQKVLQFFVMVILLGSLGNSDGRAQKKPPPAKTAQSASGKKNTAPPRVRSRSRSVGSSQASRSRRSRTRRVATPAVIGPSFDKVMSENRDLFSQGPVAEIASQQIDEPTLRAHLRFLSDDLLEGRGTGARGGLLAARYIAAQFESLGLEPAAPGGGFFQPVELFGKTTDPSTLLLVEGVSGQSVDLVFGSDFVATSDLAQPTIPVSGDLIFVGYGIHAPQEGWDDYEGIDVRGKILVMLVNEPLPTATEPTRFGGDVLTYYGRWSYKYEEAQRRGAAGVLLIHTEPSAGYAWEVVRNSWGGEQFSLAPNSQESGLRLKGWVTEDAARRLMRVGGEEWERLQRAAGQRGFRPIPLGGRLATTLQATLRQVTAPNVAGLLRGSDPLLRQQVLVYTAHWDHLGSESSQPGDSIYNGAIDNASGVAGLIALARAYVALPVRPKRSILFLATTAEEQGLLGSEFYLQNPLLPLADTIACLNLDSLNVLGRTTDIVPLGADQSTLGGLVAEVAREAQLVIAGDDAPQQGRFFRSDHFPFVKRGIPAISLLPGQQYVDRAPGWGAEQRAEIARTRYHQPGDEFDPAWDLSGMVQQVRFVFAVGLRLAREDAIPQWNPGREWARPAVP
jgi:hypothetical protein